jgi:2-oxoisovalerate dehydrogenase E1 component alpha subunit
LLKQGWLDEKDDDDAKEVIRKQVLDALKQAEKVEKPELEELVNDVYEQIPTNLQKQYDALKQHIKKYPDAYPVTSGRLEEQE